MPFNTMVAGAAVIELLRIFTSFSGAEDGPLRLAFRFEDGTVRRNVLAQEHACRICKRPLAAVGAETESIDLDEDSIQRC
jgi:hypothetical protein